MVLLFKWVFAKVASRKINVDKNQEDEGGLYQRPNNLHGSPNQNSTRRNKCSAIIKKHVRRQEMRIGSYNPGRLRNSGPKARFKMFR